MWGQIKTCYNMPHNLYCENIMKVALQWSYSSLFKLSSNKIKGQIVQNFILGMLEQTCFKNFIYKIRILAEVHLNSLAWTWGGSCVVLIDVPRIQWSLQPMLLAQIYKSTWGSFKYFLEYSNIVLLLIKLINSKFN